MNNTPFTIAQMRPIRDGMTVSRPAHLGAVPVTWFSLGAGTTITPESYDCTTLYIAAEGAGCFVLGDDARPTPICPGELLVLPPKTLCGAAADTVMIYTEIILKKENFTMNSLIKAGHPTALKDLISYEEGSIANLDVVHADNMKFVLMAFDEGTGRMSRLLASLMFNKIDFTVGRYVSIDSELEATQDDYFGTMKESAQGWETGENDYTPFVEYMLDVILKCYEDLTDRTSALSVRGSNEKTIRQYFQSIDEPVSKIEILESNPMMSQKTLERILQKMQKEHSIEKVGAARATRYQRVVRQIPM